MVKFGGHVEAVRDGDLIDANLYLVPYNQMKKHIEHAAGIDPASTLKQQDKQGKKPHNKDVVDVDGLSTTTTVSTATLSVGDTAGTAKSITSSSTEVKNEEAAESLKGGEAPAAAQSSTIPETVEVLPKKKDNESEKEYFIRIWKKSLKEAEDDFRIAREEIWRMVFDEIAAAEEENDMMEGHELIRGVNPGNAFKMYVDLSLRRQHKAGGCECSRESQYSEENCKAQELLVRLKQIHRAATINSEGLRKLVKKCDKKMNRKDGKRRTNSIQRQLSSTLLPLLYTSSLYTSQTMLYDGIEFLRDLLSDEGGIGNTTSSYDYDTEKEDYMKRTSDASDVESEQTEFNVHNNTYDSNFKPLVKRNSEMRHQESMDNRIMELDWLKSLVKSIPINDLLPKLVAHRGFHSIKDHSDKRPLENSLSAYEIAWTSGIELCECDIALTKDEKLVLAHDENFLRLSLDQGRDGDGSTSKKRVGELTFKELISLPLINGVRPPLLIDVLRSASAISEKSKLVIEIKPGNTEAAIALSRMLLRHPDLRSSVAMIMSFDVGTMHRLRTRLARGAAAVEASRSSLLAHHNNATDQHDLQDSQTIATALTNHHHQTHRRVTSYDHFGTMTSAASLTGLSHHIPPSPMNSPRHGPMPHPLYQKQRNSNVPSMSEFDSSAIGLSISHMNLNDAAAAVPPPAPDNNKAPNTGLTPLPPPPAAASTASSTAVPSAIGGSVTQSATATPLTTKSTLFGGGPPVGSLTAGGMMTSMVIDDKYSMPKLMLLTVADPPQKPCELRVKYDELHRVDKWLTEEDGTLDGVYLQYEKEMLTKEGAERLRKLSERCLVGIWNFAEKDPDDYDTFHWLVKEGNCTFVNTDLPKTFRNEILFQSQKVSRSRTQTA